MLERVRRVNRYFEALNTSFDIMVDGMSLLSYKFRMSLLPASDFSAQYRMIEICATSLDRIVHHNLRDQYANHSVRCS